MTIERVKIIELPKNTDPKGNLTFVESMHHIPFEIKRVFILNDVPAGTERWKTAHIGHAHKTLKQVLIAASGSFDVVIKDGSAEERFTLNNSKIGLYIPPMNWRYLHKFVTGTVCVTLASDYFDDDDYIRDFAQYVEMRNLLEP